MLQFTHLEVAQSKLGTLRPQVCLCSFSEARSEPRSRTGPGKRPLAHRDTIFTNSMEHAYTHTHLNKKVHTLRPTGTLEHVYIQAHTHTYTYTVRDTLKYRLTHTHTHKYTQTLTNAHSYSHRHSRIHTDINTHMMHTLEHRLPHTHIHIHTRTHRHKCIKTHSRTYILEKYKYTHTHTHTHTHTQLHSVQLIGICLLWKSSLNNNHLSRFEHRLVREKISLSNSL